MNKQVSGIVGLACRARQAVSGEFAVEQAIRRRKAKLVIVATDASVNTQEVYAGLCSHYAVPLLVYGDKVEWGNALGKNQRAAVAILHENFAQRIRAFIDDDVKNRGD